jgi:hypothetical protein
MKLPEIGLAAPTLAADATKKPSLAIGRSQINVIAPMS